MTLDTTTAPRLEDGQLMYAFAHDLRSHLRTILTRIQLVQAGAGTGLPESERGFLRDAALAASDMNGLLSAMVTYCDVTAKKEVMALPLLLKGVLMEFQGALQAIGANVSVLNELEHAVPRAVQTVLKELLANAIRFRAAGHQLIIGIATSLSTSVDGEAVEITVSDNGDGVEVADLERIFLPFQRLRSRSEYPGYGMGLAIGRRIASAYGGSLTAKPTEGAGLAVRLIIPAEPFSAPRTEAVQQ